MKITVRQSNDKPLTQPAKAQRHEQLDHQNIEPAGQGGDDQEQPLRVPLGRLHNSYFCNRKNPIKITDNQSTSPAQSPGKMADTAQAAAAIDEIVKLQLVAKLSTTHSGDLQ